MKTKYVILPLVLLAITACTGPSERDVPGEEVAVAGTPPSDGPFGLRMGQPIHELDGQVMQPGHFLMEGPPRPHEDFKRYISLYTEGGICKVSAFTPLIRDDAYGRQVRTLFDELVGDLERKYGKPEIIDVLSKGSIWDEPRDFAMGLSTNERHLMAVWKDKPDIESNLTMRIVASIMAR